MRFVLFSDDGLFVPKRGRHQAGAGRGVLGGGAGAALPARARALRAAPARAGPRPQHGPSPASVLRRLPVTVLCQTINKIIT